AFQIEPYEVTNQRYLLCVNSGTCSLPQADSSSYTGVENARLPVVNISAIQASLFCNWLDRSLPNDLQWERAARYIDERPWPWVGESPSIELANFFYEIEQLAIRPVGQYENGKSQEGVYDLAGNVWEWTRSAYYDYDTELRYNEIDPKTVGVEKVANSIPAALSVRGGSYDTTAESVMSNTIAFRLPSVPWQSNESIGFRCVSP